MKNVNIPFNPEMSSCLFSVAEKEKDRETHHLLQIGSDGKSTDRRLSYPFTAEISSAEIETVLDFIGGSQIVCFGQVGRLRKFATAIEKAGYLPIDNAVIDLEPTSHHLVSVQTTGLNEVTLESLAARHGIPAEDRFALSRRPEARNNVLAILFRDFFFPFLSKRLVHRHALEIDNLVDFEDTLGRFSLLAPIIAPPPPAGHRSWRTSAWDLQEARYCIQKWLAGTDLKTLSILTQRRPAAIAALIQKFAAESRSPHQRAHPGDGPSLRERAAPAVPAKQDQADLLESEIE